MRSFFEFKKSAGAGHCGGCFCAWIDSLVHVHRSAGVLMLWHCIWLDKVPECKEEKRRCIIYSYLAADLVLLMTDLSKWELQNLHAGPFFIFETCFGIEELGRFRIWTTMACTSLQNTSWRHQTCSLHATFASCSGRAQTFQRGQNWTGFKMIQKDSTWFKISHTCKFKTVLSMKVCTPGIRRRPHSKAQTSSSLAANAVALLGARVCSKPFHLVFMQVFPWFLVVLASRMMCQLFKGRCRTLYTL